MSDDTRIVLQHRQPTITTRVSGDLTPWKQDARPPPTDELTGRPIRNTLQAFWNTLEHHARLQNRPTRFHNSSAPSHCWTNVQTNCWGRTTIGSTANVTRTRRIRQLISVTTETRTGTYTVQCPPLEWPPDWPRASYLRKTGDRHAWVASRQRPSRFVAAPVRTSGHVHTSSNPDVDATVDVLGCLNWAKLNKRDSGCPRCMREL